MIRRLAALLALFALLLAGCGEERTFGAEEFVAEINHAGASLVLGDPLPSTQDGVEVFQIELEIEEPAVADGHDHSGGSLVVAEDAEAASGEYRRCEAAITLACFRAANVVLYFDGEPAEPHIASVGAAVRALASD